MFRLGLVVLLELFIRTTIGDRLRPYLVLPPCSMCRVMCRVMCWSCVVLRPSAMFYDVLMLVAV
jgi:hypothetical protein